MTGNLIVSRYHVERGIGHFRRNEFHEAIAAFDTALLFYPDDPYARWNRATAMLSCGDYERGFAEHDVAWRLFRWRNIDHIAHLPIWRGESGVRLLAYHELGFGDAIMALRFLPEVLRRASVVMVIDPPLLRLVRSFGVEATDQVPDDLSGFDFRLPFFGVMSALRQNIATIPSAPYIAVPWRIERGLIGIAWSGRTQTSFSGEQFVAMLGMPDAKLLALQPGNTPHGVEPLLSGDFVDLAERMAAMQHIVSVDTAAIHLAGAIGHPSAHVVLPFFGDWRWWHTARWYPALKTYRQDDPGDWAGPFARLKAAVLGRTESDIRPGSRVGNPAFVGD